LRLFSLSFFGSPAGLLVVSGFNFHSRRKNCAASLIFSKLWSLVKQPADKAYEIISVRVTANELIRARARARCFYTLVRSRTRDVSAPIKIPGRRWPRTEQATRILTWTLTRGETRLRESSCSDRSRAVSLFHEANGESNSFGGRLATVPKPPGQISIDLFQRASLWQDERNARACEQFARSSSSEEDKTRVIHKLDTLRTLLHSVCPSVSLSISRFWILLRYSLSRFVMLLLSLRMVHGVGVLPCGETSALPGSCIALLSSRLHSSSTSEMGPV